ncbi:hypothetical protein WV31_13095 [Magnetospirillum sp. ME-1]|uniref:6-hydroxymethylpterin diphosphokinase MptE-like protein n=1 Tax=Magnetospirillum sp. ME-1 TaxID=1639348 RepID=UPI000A17EE0F|nr:6-hydroxymethylpterin diphosphokinase MptE-like protein [Magnetospirillum sp. ME-1]ARJ66538.1 hypothetical protein WV31_13095 [Magnetospirillum sp. ME-1]
MTEARMEGGELLMQMMPRMNDFTLDRYGDLILENARRNQAVLDRGTSLSTLRDLPLGEGDSAIIIAAGPSIRRHDPIRLIKESGYEGTIIATESALYYCLRNGVVPHLTVTLDPHATRIVRWFGDPTLHADKVDADDYYRRQEMDTAYADEMRANEEILDLLSRHGRNIHIAMATSASEAVVNRVLDVGMPIHWWNPMLDDPDQADSQTRSLYRMNRMPCLNAGGNVGSAAWMLAHAVLGKAHVALTGMDFSYYDDTPYTSTQYYHEAVDLVGEENLEKIFVRIFNPHIGAWFYTDPAYFWYRQAFLEMAVDADCRTYNCTQGGILFGDHINFEPLADFLSTCGPISR